MRGEMSSRQQNQSSCVNLTPELDNWTIADRISSTTIVPGFPTTRFHKCTYSNYSFVLLKHTGEYKNIFDESVKVLY